jgi:hypothetical protein
VGIYGAMDFGVAQYTMYAGLICTGFVGLGVRIQEVVLMNKPELA